MSRRRGGEKGIFVDPNTHKYNEALYSRENYREEPQDSISSAFEKIFELSSLLSPPPLLDNT